MIGNPEAEKKALQATFEDVATITRPGHKKGPDGFAVPSPVVICESIICALSKVRDNSAQTDAQQNIRRDMTLFVPPEVEAKAGDTVVVKRFGRIDPDSPYEHRFEIVGVPVRYMTHVEIALKDVDIA